MFPILEALTKMLAEKSRIKWLELWEKSNKYFLNLNKSFQNKSYFRSFIHQGHEVFDNIDKIKIVQDFYTELYTHHCNQNLYEFLNKIDVGKVKMSQKQLIAPLTKEELCKIFKSSGNTAAGPDGIG